MDHWLYCTIISIGPLPLLRTVKTLGTPRCIDRCRLTLTWSPSRLRTPLCSPLGGWHMKDDMPVEHINRVLLVLEEGNVHAARGFDENTMISNAWGIYINLIESIKRRQSIGICGLNIQRPGIQPILKLVPNQNKVTQRMSMTWNPSKRSIWWKVNVPHSTIQHNSILQQRQIHKFFGHTIALQMWSTKLPLLHHRVLCSFPVTLLGRINQRAMVLDWIYWSTKLVWGFVMPFGKTSKKVKAVITLKDQNISRQLFITKHFIMFSMTIGHWDCKPVSQGHILLSFQILPCLLWNWTHWNAMFVYVVYHCLSASLSPTASCSSALGKAM